MSIFTRLFRHAPLPPPHIEVPDDSFIRETLSAARQQNEEASTRLLDTTRKQTRQAEFTREVMQGVLHRVEARGKQQ